MKRWWDGLSERDRGVLQIGTVLVVLMLLWGLAWQPLSRVRDNLRAQAVTQSDALAWMRPAAQQLAAAGGLARAPAADARSLLARTDASAREAGLGGSLVSVEPQGANRVRATLSAADFDALARWLQQVSAQGVVLEQLSVQRANAGRVDARVLLAEGAQ
ncbi:MAG: type II secretion system protein GspM [Xanthomonadaceae bacterium]|nr:type II secretion system protein GspM [Xanthomonadaceae bacterium]MDP2184394.1 type II secretion system protein GspM [Xanthomonadales bacterium]MDZ4115426.1 type II secretion system protein GspM [Xanthomonadaceae bacterium]MDZ4377518.1 type II secretion system protein GspM [Xanthomonadaceae bacterium]